MLRGAFPFSSFNRESFNTLRARLINSYPKDIDTPPFFAPTEISMDIFCAEMTKWLQYANIPYAKKNGRGIYYAEDYVKHFASGEDYISINGMSHPSYWDLSTHSCFFKAEEGHAANEALHAFFTGPTFADCGNVLQACVYRAIEVMVGTKEFNRLFGATLTPFLITKILFDKIYSATEKPDYKLDYRRNGGNPLLFLFDKQCEGLTESEIQPGDILYIKGVDKYGDKHLSGSGSGWNVICIGKNTEGENLYSGFGPESFVKPLTYKEIKSVLIKFYNQAQSLYTRKQIVKSSEHMDLDLNMDGRQLLAKAKVCLAGVLSDDVVNEDYPIVGIQYTIRFNLEKLELFRSHKAAVWHTLSIEELERKCSLTATAKPIKEATAITVETKGKSFADYAAKTPEQIKMLTAAKKFALAVCGERSSAIGLVMTGMPGIGKSHLSIAVADYVAQRGKKVVFVDEDTVGNLFQKLSEPLHGFVSAATMESIYADWLNDADVIVIDDVNSKYSTAADFIKKAVKYAMENGKAILVSGNKPFHLIQKYLPDHLGYDDARANNILDLQSLQGQSYRNTWWSSAVLQTSSGALATNIDALEMLANLNTRQPAGIILEVADDINLEHICQQYIGLTKEKNLRVRILQEPYRHRYVFDMYVHDFDQHDVFLLKHDGDFGQGEQLIKLISHVHDLGKKLIVVTNNAEKLESEINKELNDFLHKERQQRLTDRVNNLLLRKADWAHVEVKVSPASSEPAAQQHNQAKITIGPARVTPDRQMHDTFNPWMMNKAQHFRKEQHSLSHMWSIRDDLKQDYRNVRNTNKFFMPVVNHDSNRKIAVTLIDFALEKTGKKSVEQTYCGLEPGFLLKK